VAPAVEARYRIWRWLFRLLLPLAASLSGALLYWLWVDNVYGGTWFDLVGGIVLAIVAVLILIWSASAWFFGDFG